MAENILPQGRTGLVLMPWFLGVASGKAKSTKDANRENVEKHIPREHVNPHQPYPVNRITMVIFNPYVNKH